MHLTHFNHSHISASAQQGLDRPLPDIPTSSSSEDSAEDSLIDDDLDDDSAEKSESSKEEPVRVTEESHVANNVNENNSKDHKDNNKHLVEPDEVTNISDVKYV